MGFINETDNRGADYTKRINVYLYVFRNDAAIAIAEHIASDPFNYDE